jgi:cytochrome b561
MQPVSPTALRYDPTTIFFHWVTAVLVVGQWLGAQTIDWFPRGPLRVDARSVHIVVGVLIAIVLVARMYWRLTAGRRLKLADAGALAVIAKLTHWGLYALIAAMIVAGCALAWVRGDSLFNLLQIPAYAPGNHALVERVEYVHVTIGWGILSLAGLHALAALAHRYVWDDGVLSRMLPR